jgi:hypothetical protein
MKAKAILDLLPGPVNILRRRFRRSTRDAPTPSARVVVKAIDFKGRRVAEAMLNSKGMTGKIETSALRRWNMGKAHRKVDRYKIRIKGENAPVRLRSCRGTELIFPDCGHMSHQSHDIKRKTHDEVQLHHASFPSLRVAQEPKPSASK